MKYVPHIEALITSIIDAPEKDWSSSLPLVRTSSEDYLKAEKLIKRHCKDQRLKNAMNVIDKAKASPDGLGMGYEEFRTRLSDELLCNRRWKTRHKISDEFNAYFPRPRYIENHPRLEYSIFDSIELLIEKAQKLKRYEQDFVKLLMALQGLNIPEEIKKSTWINTDELWVKRSMVLKNESLEDEERLLTEEEV